MPAVCVSCGFAPEVTLGGATGEPTGGILCGQLDCPQEGTACTVTGSFSVTVKVQLSSSMQPQVVISEALMFDVSRRTSIVVGLHLGVHHASAIHDIHHEADYDACIP